MTEVTDRLPSWCRRRRGDKFNGAAGKYDRATDPKTGKGLDETPGNIKTYELRAESDGGRIPCHMRCGCEDRSDCQAYRVRVRGERGGAPKLWPRFKRIKTDMDVCFTTVNPL